MRSYPGVRPSRCSGRVERLTEGLQTMYDDSITGLTAVMALGAGLVGGVFHAFSTFIMSALARIRPSQGIAAMQSINITVLNPWFLLPFVGTAAGCAVL